MGQETITMSYSETERLRLMQQIEVEVVTLKEAAPLLGISYRQARRVWRRYRERGQRGLVHGLRGRVSNRRLAVEFADQIVARYQERYPGFGPTLACEKLSQEGLEVSRETLRRLLRARHLWLGRQVERVHRRRRARREHFGELVQFDGSDHAWFEARAPRCTLMVMVDDATGRTEALFAPSENLRAALGALQQWIERCGGVPQALYTDRLNLYHVTREPTRNERRQGSGPLSEFGAVCWRVGIRLIAARSPQAKGRVERKNATLQDRLVKELRLAGVSSMEAGNAFLRAGFLDAFNQRFTLAPVSPANYHRVVAPGQDVADLLAVESPRQVQNDWTVVYGGQTLQIRAQPHAPRPKTRVVVRERLDGQVQIVCEGRALDFEEIDGKLTRFAQRLPSLTG